MTTAYQALSTFISKLRNSFLLSLTALLVLTLSKISKFKGDERVIIGVCTIIVIFGTAMGFKSCFDFNTFLDKVESENKEGEYFSIKRARGWIYIGFIFNLIVVGILISYLSFYFLSSSEEKPSIPNKKPIE